MPPHDVKRIRFVGYISISSVGYVYSVYIYIYLTTRLKTKSIHPTNRRYRRFGTVGDNSSLIHSSAGWRFQRHCRTSALELFLQKRGSVVNNHWLEGALTGAVGPIRNGLNKWFINVGYQLTKWGNPASSC